MSDTAIRAALEARLATVSGIPAAKYRASENGEAFDPPLTAMWLRHRLAFGPERLLTKPANGGWKRQDGTWRLVLFAPLHAGTTAIDTLARAIVDAFPAGLTLTSGSTTVYCDGGRRWGGGRDLDEKSYAVPVDLYWHVHVVNTVV